ncbi:MAG: L-2-amino-thiazoline-4-carboxylic acid hydrolase [Reyranella sp.]|uniref:L-2-amino-thiazoline-4-carboxylic acid hydrolase n=1 Tax=Reyranella sp. TaxID=1929291 RepID=UPI003D0BF4BF
MPDTARISLLDEVKLQAEVILPVLRALRAELGRSRADAIVGDALRQWARALYHRIGESKPGMPREKWDAVWAEDMRPRIGAAVDREMLRDDGTVREYNVTRCQYAEFFKSLGEPELGGILLCDSDFHIAEIGGANVEFRRTQTIMQGAPYCDFRYRFK